MADFSDEHEFSGEDVGSGIRETLTTFTTFTRKERTMKIHALMGGNGDSKNRRRLIIDSHSTFDSEL